MNGSGFGFGSGTTHTQTQTRTHSEEEFINEAQFDSDLDSNQDLDTMSIQDQYKISLLKKLKYYKPDDFLKYHETRRILEGEWNFDFERNLAPKIESIFERHYLYLRNQYSNILYLASPFHVMNLISLVKYHLKRNYNYNLLKKNIEVVKRCIDYHSRKQQKEERNVLERKKKAIDAKRALMSVPVSVSVSASREMTDVDITAATTDATTAPNNNKYKKRHYRNCGNLNIINSKTVGRKYYRYGKMKNKYKKYKLGQHHHSHIPLPGSWLPPFPGNYQYKDHTKMTSILDVIDDYEDQELQELQGHKNYKRRNDDDDDEEVEDEEVDDEELEVAIEAE
jgi:hypothetical protein